MRSGKNKNDSDKGGKRRGVVRDWKKKGGEGRRSREGREWKQKRGWKMRVSEGSGKRGAMEERRRGERKWKGKEMKEGKGRTGM